MAVPLSAFYPANRGSIGGSRERAAHHPAEVICDHVVVADPAFLAIDAIQQLDELYRFHKQPGIFLNLADHSLMESFAHLNQPSGNGPASLGRLFCALHEQDPSLVHHDRADPDQRRRWIFTLHLLLR